MPIQRVAIIFDNAVRPDTTGVYCHRALASMIEATYVLPTQLAAIPWDRFDLYLYIDDGLDYPLPKDLHPSAFWAIDTHLNPARIVSRAAEIDYVFSAQRDGVEILRSQGINCVAWLPLACDPDIHKKHNIAKTFDVSYVGHINSPVRASLLQRIQATFPRSFIGQRFFDEMAITYSASNIIFNRSIRNDVNMRVFEAMACGALLITNDLAENGLLPAIRAAGGDVVWTEIFVVHSGSDCSSEGRHRKQTRDLRLLQLELQDRPDHPFTSFNLGMTYADMGDHAKAIEALQASMRVSNPTESHVRKLYALLTNSYSQLGDGQNAWDTCLQGLALFPDDPELTFRKGVLAQNRGLVDEAEKLYLAILDVPDRPRRFSSMDRGITGFKARHNLAVLYADLDRFSEAAVQWQKAIEEEPAFFLAWHGLGDAFVRMRRFDDAENLVQGLVSRFGETVESLLLRGEIAKAQGHFSQAHEHFQTAFERHTGDTRPLRALCELQFAHGEPAAAETHLKQLCAREPTDAATFHNLGIVYVRMERYSDALEVLRRSLDLRPNYAPTQSLYNHCLTQVQQSIGSPA